jgi:hypothetical protein
MKAIQVQHQKEMALLRMEIDRARTATELEGIKSMLNDLRLQTEGKCVLHKPSQDGLQQFL